MYFYCPEEKESKIKQTYENIRHFLQSREMADILSSFGLQIPDAKDTEELVARYLKISALWDYRGKQRTASDARTGEKARWLVSDASVTETQRNAVMRAVAPLGLVGHVSPQAESYDYILALGGARYSCLYRPGYAVDIMGKLHKPPRALVMLSGCRPVAESEREATNTYAPGAQTEYDLINCGIGNRIPLINISEEKKEFENPNYSYAVRRAKTKEGVAVLSMAAPSSEPEKRRAHSADTFRFFAGQCGLAENARILLITSEIYVPYQQLEAIRTLAVPENVVVETIGFPNEWTGQLQGMRAASNYLQEIRSAIQAMGRFVEQYHD